MPKPYKPNFETCWVEIARVGFGVDQFTFFDRGYVAPLGVFWCISVHANGLTRTEIYDTWVLEQARRQGIARRLLQSVKENADVVTTVGVKSEMGEGFVKATGFKYDKGLAAWILRCPRAPAVPPVKPAPPRKRKRRA